jgi:hypothetical protein
MSTDTSKAMQEALQSAIARMNNGNGNGSDHKPNTGDLLGAFMPLLPKLFQNNESGEQMLEKIDSLQRSDIAPLREQVQILRKQCYRMLKSQEQLLSKIHEIQRQQVAASGAVLDLAQQMARITFVEDTSAGEDDLERDPPPAPAVHRVKPRTSRTGNGKRQRDT